MSAVIILVDTSYYKVKMSNGRAGLRQCRIWRFLFLSGSKKRLLAIILSPTFSLSKII
jgi:hypothetical protein